MRRLIVVSNRVADLEKGAQSGGLAVAVGEALKETGGLWFGWDGSVVDDDGDADDLKVVNFGAYMSATLPLTSEEYRDYYLGFSNKVLWPAFHYRLDLAAYESAFYQVYRKVNGRLADCLARLIKPFDVVWIHDYHLIPLASELRARKIMNRIGFFLHIPFPPPDVLTAVPEHEWLVSTLFSYDVVGFQTSGDLGNFRRYVVENAGGIEGEGDEISAFGKSTVAQAFPIGIDVTAFHAMAHSPEADALVLQLRQRTLERTQILGVDRLDYTKGLPDRLRAFKRLLELYPENCKRVTLMQIAPPTREEVEAYTDMRQTLEQLSGSINGDFGDFDWTPVRYIHRSVARDRLAAVCRGSKVGLVTPLRDGMNLVAKEYVAAQDPDDPGVLVLSRFAGAAEDLLEALLVNPYDVDEVAHAMQEALTMPKAERIDRYNSLIARVRERDVQHWRESFLAALIGDERSMAA
ncbi:MAG: trehalose-6-phosphate synthase [Hyphomicrobiaceae bacterium]